jgi:hypothetical protein
LARGGGSSPDAVAGERAGGDFCVVVALEATGFFSLTGFLALPARLRWAEMDNEPKNISSKVIFYLSLASLISMTSNILFL